jgi:16S rRNA (guanine(1405)-N(7))-methyltransferase
MPGDDVLAAVAEAVVAQSVKQYRIEGAAARALILDVFSRDTALRAAAESAGSAEKLQRTRAFKAAATRAKQRIYYGLRRYRATGSELSAVLEPLRALAPGAAGEERERAVRAALESHRSMGERLATLGEFYERLFAAVGQPRTILDIGCGLQPLAFPLDSAGRSVERYVALDEDAQAIAAVDAYSRVRADGRLSGVRSDLSAGWAAALSGCGQTQFDLALMLKVVPVVDRQNRALLETLAETPATRWVLTGSKVALAKRKNIENRERGTLESFVKMAGRKVLDEFAVGEEFALLV